MISSRAQLVELTSVLLKFVCEVLICCDLLQASLICVQRGQRNTRLWMAPHGWMRFHRGTLSVYRWFKPLSHDRDLCCHWEWKKKPSVFVSHCGCCCCLPLTVNLSVTVMLRNQPQLPIDPATSLDHPSLNISNQPSIHPFSQRASNVCLFTFTEHLPPPPSALVATETADSGRVGGCLRALAALPHAVLSQYISASVLLLWPWYADSSGGSVTILSTTQRLFVQFLQRTCTVFRVALSFVFSFSSKIATNIENLFIACWQITGAGRDFSFYRLCFWHKCLSLDCSTN